MEGAPVARGVSREAWIGGAATAVAVGAMAVDHLLGNDADDDETGLVDPSTFGISAGLSIAVAVFLFGLVVPRARAHGPDRAARVGLACSVLSIVPGFLVLWLGVPFVVAGAGVALGLAALERGTARLGIAAVAVGASRSCSERAPTPLPPSTSLRDRRWTVG